MLSWKNSPVPMLPLWLLQVLHQDVVVRGLEIYQDQRSKILMLEQDKNKGQRQSTWRSVWISKGWGSNWGIINFYYYNIIITSIKIVIFLLLLLLQLHYNSVVPLPILVPQHPAGPLVSRLARKSGGLREDRGELAHLFQHAPGPKKTGYRLQFFSKITGYSWLLHRFLEYDLYWLYWTLFLRIWLFTKIQSNSYI